MDCYYIGYQFWTKTRKLSVVLNIIVSCQIVLKICTEHGSRVLWKQSKLYDIQAKEYLRDLSLKCVLKIYRIPQQPKVLLHVQYISQNMHTNYSDVIMGTIASQITSLAIVYLTVYSSADQIKHQSSVSLVFMRGIHRWPVNSPHKGPVTRKMCPFDDVIMCFVVVCCVVILFSVLVDSFRQCVYP